MLNKYFKKSKAIPIDKFVENVLYDKKYGYYAKKNPFGKNGDFITSPDITFLFSEMIAIWIIYFWEKLDKPKKFNIVELGPGTGKLSKILLETFKKFPEFYKSQNTFLYERSKKLKLVQKKFCLEVILNGYLILKRLRKGQLFFLVMNFLMPFL